MDKDPRESKPSPLLIGDYYDGAYGPTVLMLLSSSIACRWLQTLFRDVAAHHLTHRTMTDEPVVKIANVQKIQLVNRPDGPRVSFRRTDREELPSFVWSATSDGWIYMADLVASLCKKSGHHYLTEDKADDATVQVSFGEPDVLAAASANGILQP